MSRVPIDLSAQGVDARDALVAATLTGELVERDSIGWTFSNNDMPILPLCDDAKHDHCVKSHICAMKHMAPDTWQTCRKFRVRQWTQVEKLEG